VASPSGWINEELFEKWFDHFLKKVRPDACLDPVLLILDGHTSHTKNLSVVSKARENNVVLLSLPSHCTHKLHPLDVAVFKSINTFYDEEVSTWLTQHPGRIVTEKEIPELFKNAYGKGGTIKNAVSGFKKSGIFPFNPEIFTEEDFIASELNELPIVADVPHHSLAETSVPLDLGSRELNYQATEVEKSETVTASTTFHVDDIQKAPDVPIKNIYLIDHSTPEKLKYPSDYIIHYFINQ
jgi:hypothetical protein